MCAMHKRAIKKAVNKQVSVKSLLLKAGCVWHFVIYTEITASKDKSWRGESFANYALLDGY